ncbi:proteinase inhibitor I16 subtilisin-type inhibitor [Planomonospora sphaerica]|uniref:Proteinase inhibitor I16 subtilisin-type inhibitor n=1 Tax=Planomonospora sphaerica TaxID=161355 RepID=A0A171DMC0_9ACTN|nr:SSI family serine proteinase inhibitor [Planomonospora sphaerica]GAT70098.1 proteinase inhibitor I16 subtilisin-type inhibitor [Planomonospora sphaerica]
MRIRPSAHVPVRRFAAASAAGLAALLGAAPASAGAPAADGPTGSYLLEVAREDGSAPARKATLTCGPDGGTHPRAAAACDQLRRAGGRVEDVPERPGACTLEYAPVRVTATGTWQGRRYRYAETHPNRCAAIRATGGVLFAF